MRISQARDFIPANYNRILLSSRHVLCDISGDGPERADADGVGDFHGRRQARAVSEKCMAMAATAHVTREREEGLLLLHLPALSDPLFSELGA